MQQIGHAPRRVASRAPGQPPSRAWTRALAWLLGLLAAAGTPAASPPAPFYATPFERQPSAAQLTQLGRALFSDPSLSASGRQACAACHDPAHHYGPPNSLPVQRGGRNGRDPGLRSAPQLTYTQTIPPFTEHFNDIDGDDGLDQGPAGGRSWDGRADSAHEQARAPLFSPFEMANASDETLTRSISRGSNAQALRRLFGPTVLEDPVLAVRAVTLALEVFQQSPQEFYPYSSKYDAVLRGRASLSPAEQRGLEAFNSPQKGDCARCHPSSLKGGAFPQFTDFGYVALGLPRNPQIPANRDPTFFDLGLCGPLRTDLAQHRYCGLFRTPSLRNVATRSVFFHNGGVRNLRDAVRFYAERDTRPERWYPRRKHAPGIDLYNDLPLSYRANIERGPPFPQQVGEPARLDAQDIDDLVAFLATLTDGFEPPAGSLPIH